MLRLSCPSSSVHHPIFIQRLLSALGNPSKSNREGMKRPLLSRPLTPSVVTRQARRLQALRGSCLVSRAAFNGGEERTCCCGKSCMALIHPLVDQLLNTAHVHFETKGEEGPRDTTKKVRISSKDAAAADPWKPGAKMTAMTVHHFLTP